MNEFVVMWWDSSKINWWDTLRVATHQLVEKYRTKLSNQKKCNFALTLKLKKKK